MNNRLPIIAILSLLAVFLTWVSNLAFPQESSSPKKYALLVAVNRYEDDFLNHPPLKYPEADAIALKEELAKSGYVVEMLIGKQATQAAIRAKLTELNTKGNAEGAVILGFFGHGVEYESSKEAMYIPYDSVRRLAKDASGKQLFADDGSNTKLTEPDPKSLVGMSEMLDAMRLCKAGNKLLLADCCRKNPNAARGTRAFGSSVKLSDLPNNSAAIFACSVGEEAQEDDAWKHGAMTKCFLDLMPEMSNESADVGAIAGKLRKQVAALVTKSSNGSKRQTVHPIVNGVVELQLLASIQKSSNKIKEASKPNESKSMSSNPPKSSKKDNMEGSKAGELREDNSLGMKLVWIPAGKFTMGSPWKSQVPVTLTSGFWLGETEVTQGQWTAVMGTEPWKGKDFVKEGETYPATYVSWEDAVEFCKKLSEQDGKLYRLPTEAEWEYACRGGTSTKYSFGDDATDLSRYAWFHRNAWDVGEKYAHEVKKKLANPYGLYDMHGNVREMCSDWYGEYSNSATIDPTGPANPGFHRVSRGGDWSYLASECESADRNTITPDGRHFSIGFRVAVSR